MPISDSTREQLDELVARYPRPRSALMPMLHLLQSIEGEVTPDGIGACADAAGVSAAEATAVASFYTMYKRRPGATHHIGVCVNTMCGLLGGDAVYDALAQRLGLADQPLLHLGPRDGRMAPGVPVEAVLQRAHAVVVGNGRGHDEPPSVQRGVAATTQFSSGGLPSRTIIAVAFSWSPRITPRRTSLP